MFRRPLYEDLSRYFGSMQRSLDIPRTALVFTTILVFGNALEAQQTSKPSFATVRGSVYDSVHQRPLAGALVIVQGLGRVGMSDDKGDYVIDSVPPGSHRLSLAHPLLDTLSVEVLTPPIVLRPGELLLADIATPSARQIVTTRCPAAILAMRGPAALVGRVTDPDSLAPALGSKVQLSYEESVLGFTGKTVVREAQVDSTGAYVICGLPTQIVGRLQVFRGGSSSGQVNVAVDGPLAWRSVSISSLRAVAAWPDSSGKPLVISVGTSRVRGRVTDVAGHPIADARVSVEVSGRATTTNAAGFFSLDSLPAGTQNLEVRKLGFAATDKAVELLSNRLSETSIVLDARALAPVRIESTRDDALASLGYTDRRKAGFGYFLDGKDVRHDASRFTDVLRGDPMLKFTPTGNGRVVVQNARDPNYGCVNYFVDGAPWQEFRPGDIDDYLSAGEVQALEVYNPSSVPPRFQVGGRTSCTAIIIWTSRSTNRPRRK